MYQKGKKIRKHIMYQNSWAGKNKPVIGPWRRENKPKRQKRREFKKAIKSPIVPQAKTQRRGESFGSFVKKDSKKTAPVPHMYPHL